MAPELSNSENYPLLHGGMERGGTVLAHFEQGEGDGLLLPIPAV